MRAVARVCIDSEDTGLFEDDCSNITLSFSAMGNTEEELVEDAVFWRVNNDGAERGYVRLVDCGGKKFDVGMEMIHRGLAEADREERPV